MKHANDNGVNSGIYVTLTIVGICLLLAFVFWGFPQYNVYVKRLSGEALLREAESSRMILIQEATAKKEAAKLLAGAEVERARGVAEANSIIGESLKGNESYLRYLWVMGLQDGHGEVIYVPTEANLPILEATRNLRSE